MRLFETITTNCVCLFDCLSSSLLQVWNCRNSIARLEHKKKYCKIIFRPVRLAFRWKQSCISSFSCYFAFLLYLLSLCLINNKILQIQVSRQRDSFVLFHCWLGNFAQISILLLCTNTILPLFFFSTLLFVSFGLMVGFRLLFFALFCSICVCVSVIAPVIL